MPENQGNAREKSVSPYRRCVSGNSNPLQPTVNKILLLTMSPADPPTKTKAKAKASGGSADQDQGQGQRRIRFNYSAGYIIRNRQRN
jgi:hypothetical protein